MSENINNNGEEREGSGLQDTLFLLLLTLFIGTVASHLARCVCSACAGR